MNKDHITFDIGRVLVHVDFTPFFKVYSEFGLDAVEDPMVFLNDLHGQQDVGLTTVARAAKERFGVSERQEESLLEAWDEVIIPEPKMMKLLQDIKNADIRVALLSNMGLEHANTFRKKFPEIFRGCDLHLSCEVGARKPGKLFYQSFLWDHEEYKGCLYLDDLLSNIVVGRDYGFTSFQFNLENGDVVKIPEVREKLGI